MTCDVGFILSNYTLKAIFEQKKTPTLFTLINFVLIEQLQLTAHAKALARTSTHLPVETMHVRVHPSMH